MDWGPIQARIDDVSGRDGFNGFPFDRNGIRLGIAAIYDEADELFEEWHSGRVPHTGYMYSDSAPGIRRELMDIIAVAAMMYQAADEVSGTIERHDKGI
jgi:hypothetical protein